MARGHARQAWNHTALLACLLMNTAMSYKPYHTPEDFHPVKPARQPARLSPKESLDFLGRFHRN